RTPDRHCLRQTRSVCARERKRRSNPWLRKRQDGLLRCARNDDRNAISATHRAHWRSVIRHFRTREAVGCASLTHPIHPPFCLTRFEPIGASPHIILDRGMTSPAPPRLHRECSGYFQEPYPCV